MNRCFTVLIVFLGLMIAGASVSAADRHVGYYYPEPQTKEVYKARAQTLPDSTRKRRIGFVTGMTVAMQGAEYPQQYAIFAKGSEAEKLIIVSLYDGYIDTLYRARALLAAMTAVARQSPFFRERGVDDLFTFFDLLVLLGFKQLTISDGQDFAHQVTFE